MGAALVVAAVCYLAFIGAAASWQYYMSVDEAVADREELQGSRLRVSGRVLAGSLSISDDRRQAAFDLMGDEHSLHVTCHCLLPDNLVEEIDVVVEGVFKDKAFRGDKVITRCASKYQPAESAVLAETRAVERSS